MVSENESRYLVMEQIVNQSMHCARLRSVVGVPE
jgi:hypothetical protein